MSTQIKTIGVLTSGGDAPGMNAAVRAVVRAAIKKGMKVMGIRRGYNGLIHAEMEEMTMRSVSGIIQYGGTMLRTARCLEFKERAGVERAKETCVQNNIDGLVVIGGDGSFRGAADLSAMGVPCIGVPGTIDNDISCTDYTIGYDTAMNTAMEMVDKLRDTCQSHDRCSVVEVMGRRAGYLALNTGIAVGATSILVPEHEQEVEQLIQDLIRKIRIAKDMDKEHFIVMVAEGIGNSIELAKRIERETGIESRATILGHIQRGGNPTLKDRVAASQLGYYAVELLAKGIGNRVVGFRNEQIVDYDIQEALSMTKRFPEELFELADVISF